MDFDIPEELQLLARTARDFVETRLQPLEKEVERTGTVPIELGREIRRVLRPAGRAVILDLHTPRNPVIRRLYRSYSYISPRLAAALGSDPEAYRYLPRSIEAFYDPEALAALLRNAGFMRVRFERLTFGIAAIHAGEA